MPSSFSPDASPGRVYEDFLTQFASAEGKNGGQFDTLRCVVRVLVEMLAPFKGESTAGMFVQSERFVEENGGPTRRRCLCVVWMIYRSWRWRNGVWIAADIRRLWRAFSVYSHVEGDRP